MNMCIAAVCMFQTTIISGSSVTHRDPAAPGHLGRALQISIAQTGYMMSASLQCCYLLIEQDPDLKALRDRREWLDAMERARGGVSSKAYASARAESKSPFRLVRLLTFGGLGAGAGIGLFIIISRLITALRGRRYLKRWKCRNNLSLAPSHKQTACSYRGCRGTAPWT